MSTPKDTAGAENDQRMSLPRLLSILSCSKGEVNNLAKTSRERLEIEALVRLWVSLGRPTSRFWRELSVQWDRIWLSYDEMQTKYCCDKFEKGAGTLQALSGGGFMYPPEMHPNAQFQPDDDGKTWNINGCCGGGCFVVTEMLFCPFCGSKLEHPSQKV